MAKRFTDSGKWVDRWFRKLPTKMKLLWCYMLDNCDSAGVWDTDLELFEMFTGEVVSIEEFNEIFKNRIQPVGTDKVWIKKFVAFQYGKLSSECKPHKSIIDILKKHTLYEEYLKGIHTLQEKEKEIGKGKSLKEEMTKDEITKARRNLEKVSKTDLLKNPAAAFFDHARVLYPGTKGGLLAEWEGFSRRYHSEMEDVLPRLQPAINAEIAHKKALLDKGQMVPSWKHFSTWINQRCWEQEFAKVPEGKPGQPEGTVTTADGKEIPVSEYHRLKAEKGAHAAA